MRRRSLVALVALTLLSAGCLGALDGDDDLSELADDEEAPIAFFNVVETEDPMTFRFDATPSIGDGLSYAWDLGDGATSSGDPIIEYTYTDEDRLLPVTLTVTDGEGSIDRTVEPVEIGNASQEAPSIQIEPLVHWLGVANAIPLDLVGDIDDVIVGSANLGEELPDWYAPDGEHDDHGNETEGHDDGHDHEHGGVAGPTGSWEDSAVLGTNDRHETTFDERGVYVYASDPHPSMTGIIVVANTGNAFDDEAAVTMYEDRFFTPQILEVQPGTTVTWENKADVMHDVTLQQYLPLDAFHTPMGPAVSAAVDEPGVHLVYAIAKDDNGNFAIDHVPILVTEKEPQRGLDVFGSGSFDGPEEDPDEYAFTLQHEGGASVTWGWESSLDEDLFQQDPLEGVRLDIFQGNASEGEPVYSTTSPDEGFTLEELEPDSYTMVVTNEDALMVEYRFHAHVHVDATPPWIDDDHDDHEH